MADRPAPLPERLLWSTRLLLGAAVAGSAVLGAAVLWLASVDVVRFVFDLADYTTNTDATARGELVGDVVKIIDTYLLAAILIVVAFGLYELFVSRIDARGSGHGGPRVLVAGSLDDLKDRVAKLVVLILVIEFFQRALKTGIDTAGDLLLLGGGIALVSAAIALPALADAVKRKGAGD